MDLRNSLSMGVVSGTRRAVKDDSQVLYIQTDAAINPGDSGGALVDVEGRLVGPDTFIMTRSGGSEEIGFAVPVDTVRNVYRELLLHGAVLRGSIGVNVQDITPLLIRGLSLAPPDAGSPGALIADVDPGGSGDIGGLKRRDIVLRMDDECGGMRRTPSGW